ncbi:MAG: PAS domain S-box protein [Chloroflexi bacterium]|nr:PAS domain S-box protein [Chloroflexota bacterium]
MITLLDYRVRQRDFLLEIARAISAQLDLSEVLRLVLNASVAMFSGQVGFIALRDATDAYRIRATLGVNTQQVSSLNDQLQTLIANSTNDYEAFNTQLNAMANDLDAKLVQAMALPLIFANEPVGMLVVFRSVQRMATPDDIQVLQSFANQAAIAVHNAQLYERINQERKRLAAILEHSADGVMILDGDLNILRFNRALERMTGWSAVDAIGLPQADVLIWQRLDQGIPLSDELGDGWPFRVPDDAPETLYIEGDLLRRDGLTLSIGIIYAPLLNSEGKLTNIIANVRDITNFRQAQMMQNVFISSISHELKTPVALIKGHAATLRRDDVEWDLSIVREYSAVIEDESDRLTDLIENLLTASKIQAERRVDLQLGDVCLDQLAARAVERFSTQTDRHNFELNFPPDYPVIPGDEARLRQVLDNLLSNAIKYSPAGGIIEVGGSVAEHDVYLYVRDEGVGLTEADQARVFERFYRVDSNLSRKTQGTGLGLYLSKAIVEAHGGAMSVYSRPGHGTTFYFTLPTDMPTDPQSL